jgi:hypothetical protein
MVYRNISAIAKQLYGIEKPIPSILAELAIDSLNPFFNAKCY